MSVLLDPKGHSDPGTFDLAPRRFTSLDGARLGLMVSSKHNSDVLVEDIGQLLSNMFGLKSVETFTKPTATRVAPQALIDEAVEKCDIVVHAIGD